MPTFLDYFNTSIAVLTATFIVTWPLFGKKYYESWLDNKFNSRVEEQKHELSKRFETYKQDLLIQAEFVRTDNQRRLQDFGHFTVKKHEVYAKLYRLLRIAHDSMDLTNPEKLLSTDYMKVELSQVQKQMVALEINQTTQKAVNDLWVNSRPVAISLLEPAVADGKKRKASRSYQRAVNYKPVNELYLSTEVNWRAEMLLNTIMRYGVHIQTGSDKLDERKAAAEENMLKVFATMSDELRAGDYSPPGHVIVTAENRSE